MLTRFEHFSFAISELSRIWHKIAADELGPHQLRTAHATYLTTLLRYPQGITAPDLCEVCGKDKADVSRMMSILAEKGLVVKLEQKGSLYRGLYQLTQEGQTLAREISEKATLAVEKSSLGLGPEEILAFHRALDVIIKNLNEIAEKGL